MVNRDWFVTDNGDSHAYPSLVQATTGDRPYRLYRFLTEVEDILDSVSENQQRLEQMTPLVRRLLNSSDWLQFEVKPPNLNTGWSVNRLYSEPKFPLTVQMVAWLPGRASTVHNHATWGIVALLSGREKNCLWRRAGDVNNPDRLDLVEELTLDPGDVVGFMPEAIHCVEALGDEPTITFNLYGLTDYQTRFKFDLENHSAQLF